MGKIKVHRFAPKLSVKDERKPRYLGERVRAFIDLMRPLTLSGAFLAGFCVVILYSYFFRIPLDWQLGVAAGLCMVLLQGAGQALNQSLPEEIAIDILNEKTYRPTVKGTISPTEAKYFAFVLLSLAIVAGFHISLLFGSFTLIIAFFAVFYTLPPLRIKKRFFISNAWQGIARGFLPVVSVWSLSPEPLHILPLALGIVIATWCCGAQSTKDVNDVSGDRSFGVETFFVVLGKAKAIRLVGVLMALSFSILVIFVIGRILPVGLVGLLLLSIPSLLIIKTLKNPVDLSLSENQASWVLFYVTLGLFYILSAVLVNV